MGRVGLPRDFDLSPMGIIGWLMILVQTILLIIALLRLTKRQVISHLLQIWFKMELIKE